MDPKNFKFNDDAFDDVMSSSEDEKNDIKSNSFEDEFEDIFSGDDNAENGHHRDFTDEYFVDEQSAPKMPPHLWRKSLTAITTQRHRRKRQGVFRSREYPTT